MCILCSSRLYMQMKKRDRFSSFFHGSLTLYNSMDLNLPINKSGSPGFLQIKLWHLDHSSAFVTTVTSYCLHSERETTQKFVFFILEINIVRSILPSWFSAWKSLLKSFIFWQSKNLVNQCAHSKMLNYTADFTNFFRKF